MIEWFWGLFGWKRKPVLYAVRTGSEESYGALQAFLREHVYRDEDGHWHKPTVVPILWRWVR